MSKYLISCLILLLFSCGNRNKHPQMVEIPKRNKQLTDTTIFRTLHALNKQDSSRLSIHYQYFNEITAPWQDSLNQKVAAMVCEKMELDTCQKQVFAINATFFSKKLDGLYQSAKKDYETAKYKALWEFSLSFEIDQTAKNFTTLGVFTTSFFGQNSALNTQEYVHFSKTDGKTLFLADVIKADKSYLKLVDSLFRAQNNLGADSEYKELGFWFDNGKFALSNQFYFKHNTLCFVYNPYDVAPVSYGKMEVNVPLELTKPYLKIDF